MQILNDRANKSRYKLRDTYMIMRDIVTWRYVPFVFFHTPLMVFELVEKALLEQSFIHT